MNKGYEWEGCQSLLKQDISTLSAVQETFCGIHDDPQFDITNLDLVDIFEKFLTQLLCS
jgi:hypothetical protein